MSYPIYLLHEPIGIPLISALVRRGLRYSVSFSLALAAVMFLSLLVVAVLEPMLKRQIMAVLGSPRRAAQIQQLHSESEGSAIKRVARSSESCEV